jgi:hypothetical protein
MEIDSEPEKPTLFETHRLGFAFFKLKQPLSSIQLQVQLGLLSHSFLDASWPVALGSADGESFYSPIKKTEGQQKLDDIFLKMVKNKQFPPETSFIFQLDF